MIRPTTTSVLTTYRHNLYRSTNSVNSARDTVLSGKRYNSFADDPAAVSRSFQLRTSLLRLDSQYGVSQSVSRKYDVAWNTLSQVSDDLKTAKETIKRAANGASGAGMNTLGQELSQLAESIVRSMNVQYSDNFVFAGADGLNVPLELKNGTLTYRGVNIDTTDPAELEKLKYYDQTEKKYVDVGLGMTEIQGEIVDSSAFDCALQATDFLGYGVDADGDPVNVVSIIGRMGDILKRCTPDGKFQPGPDEADFERLHKKFDDAMAAFSNKYTQLDARTSFLKNNQKQLESNSASLQEQIVDLENVDPADAIIAFSWAQYCYNSALKVGNNILSQSLIDYMNR